MRNSSIAVPFAVIVAGITGATSAEATVRVGYAMLIERNVSGSISGQLHKVAKGDDVFENELIRTEMASHARLLFIDKTQLVLGPTAIAKLDRLVFNPDQSVNTLTVSARAGAIRWISGDSVSSAYQIETPIVTIRPHGTTFDLLVEPQRTTVILQEGIIEVCLSDAPQRCRILSRRGEWIRATRADLEAPQQGGPGSSDFEDRCLSAASKECIVGKSANPPPEPSQKPGIGKKRAEPRANPNTPKEAYAEPQAPKKKKYEPREEPLRTGKKPYYAPQPSKVTEAPHNGPSVQSPNILSIIGGTIGIFKAQRAYNHTGKGPGYTHVGRGPGHTPPPSGKGPGYFPAPKGPMMGSSPAPKGPMMGSSPAPKGPIVK